MLFQVFLAKMQSQELMISAMNLISWDYQGPQLLVVMETVRSEKVIAPMTQIVLVTSNALRDQQMPSDLCLEYMLKIFQKT